MSKLDSITETYDSINGELDIEKEEDPDKLISNLQEKIIRLEKMNNDLKTKNEELKKNNIENNSVMKKMGHVGLRRKFTAQGTFKKVTDDSVKIAELVKEKDDLQEINEKMLDLLTEKEMENEDLNQKLENYKLEAKLENEKNLEKIQSLEDKISLMESEKGGTIYDIDDVMNEYNKSKERLKRQINDYCKNEEDLKAQLALKDKTIQKLNDEIQNLEIDKLKLVNQNSKNDKLKEKEVFEIEQLKTEVDKLKRDIDFLNDRIKIEKENAEKLKSSHKAEVESIQKQVEAEQNNAKSMKEEKVKEINTLKSEITKLTKEVNLYSKKAEMAEKRLDDEKQKNFMIQNKLDKKGKELQEMNEYTKKLLANKDNLITQYEEKIEEITKDKNELIAQNKQLLNNNNEYKKSDENSQGDIQKYIQENKLLTEEIKGLKEQIENQTKDLVELNSFEKELVRLRELNEHLSKDNKSLKIQMEELKKDGGNDGLSAFPERKRGMSVLSKQRKMTFGTRTQSCEIQSQINSKKQVEALKKMLEDEKKDFEAQIDKIKMEVAELKVKNLDLQYDKEQLQIKYKSMIKSITNQCKKKGITLNINKQ